MYACLISPFLERNALGVIAQTVRRIYISPILCRLGDSQYIVPVRRNTEVHVVCQRDRRGVYVHASFTHFETCSNEGDSSKQFVRERDIHRLTMTKRGCGE